MAGPTLKEMRKWSGHGEASTRMLTLLAKNGSTAASAAVHSRVNGGGSAALSIPEGVDESLELSASHAVFPAIDSRCISNVKELTSLLEKYGCSTSVNIGWHLAGKGTRESPLRAYYLVELTELHLLNRLDRCIYDNCRALACFALFPRALAPDHLKSLPGRTSHISYSSTTITLIGVPDGTDPIRLKRAARPGGQLTCCRVCLEDSPILSCQNVCLEFIHKPFCASRRPDSSSNFGPVSSRRRAVGINLTSITGRGKTSPILPAASSSSVLRKANRNSGWMGKGTFGGNPRGRSRNLNRSRVFRHWLEQTFGVKRLRSGSGVMDVAGGKGELSFELKTYGGIESTIVDPRPMDIVRMLKGLTAMHIMRMRRSNKYSHVPNVDMPLALKVNLQLPAHVRAWFPPRNSKQSNDKIDRYYNEELATLDHEVNRLEQLCSMCSCCVGMHADQATEAIVDFGLSTGKPFAVVPCCVFPDMFRDRRLQSGKRVRTYDQFLEYLLEKGAKKQTLDFPGRNVVIYGGV